MRYRRTLLLAVALLAALGTRVQAQGVVTMDLAPTLRRAWFGFSFERTETRRPGETVSNISITSVVDGSPAQKAGLRKGDTILRINGLGASEPLLSTIGSSLTPGDTVTFRIRRDGREQDVHVIAAAPPREYARRTMIVSPDSVRGLLRIFVDSVRAGLDTLVWLPGRDSAMKRLFIADSLLWRGDSTRFHVFSRNWQGGDSIPARFFPRVLHDSMFPSGDRVFRYSVPERGNAEIIIGSMAAGMRALAGAELQDLNPELARYFKAKEGVLVVNAPEGTPARRAGLQAGDVITGVNGKQVGTIRELRREVDRGTGSTVKIDVVRNGERKSVQLRK